MVLFCGVVVVAILVCNIVVGIVVSCVSLGCGEISV